MAILPLLNFAVVGPPIIPTVVPGNAQPPAFPSPVIIVHFTGSRRRPFQGKITRTKVKSFFVFQIQTYPPPIQVVRFTGSRKRKPHKGRATWFGVHGTVTGIVTLSVNPPPVQVVHFTGSKVLRGRPRKGTALRIKTAGKFTGKIKPKFLKPYTQILRRRRLPSTEVTIGKIPRHFSNIVQPFRTRPVQVVHALRRRTVPGDVTILSVHRTTIPRTRLINVLPIKVIDQVRSKRLRTRGKVKWFHISGVTSAPATSDQLLSPPITVVQFTGNRRKALRPHTIASWISRFAIAAPLPKAKPLIIVSQVLRKRQLPKTTTQFTKVKGIRTPYPKIRPILNVDQILRRRQLPKTNLRLGKVPRTFGVSNVGTVQEYRPTYRPRRR